MGCKVSRADYLRLLGIEKEIRNLQLNKPLQSGFDYRDWPVIKPVKEGKDFEIKMVHWEYIPPTINDEFELREARIMFHWINARSENLFVNEKGRQSMWQEGATRGRCLALLSGFYEFRHMQKIGKRGKPIQATDAYPYYITLKDRPEVFYVAAISREWENHARHQTADTMAVVTRSAIGNRLMETIHNTKLRMPTILPAHLAEEWIQPGLSKERVMEIASYQMPEEEMAAWPVENFLRSKPEDPTREIIYENLPAL